MLSIRETEQSFQNVTKSLNINENSYVDSSPSITDSVDKAIN